VKADIRLRIPIKDSDGVGEDLLLAISRLTSPVDTVVPVLHHREGSSYEEDDNKGADTNEGERGRWRDGGGGADAALVPVVVRRQGVFW